MGSLDEPHVGTGLSDNWIGDIVVHKDAVWLATGRGLSFSYFDEGGWNRYDTTNGLPEQDISAIYSSGDDIWIALNHFEEGYDDAFADGIAYSSDEGRTWVVLDSEVIENTYGYQRTVYDMAGVDDKIFCASWGGGLIGSFDAGFSWQNIYAYANDSINLGDPGNLGNLHFAVAVDTLHGDSLVVWTGTALGIRRLVYAPNREKLTANNIYDFAAIDSFIYIAGDSGLTRLKFIDPEEGFSNMIFRTSFTNDGLPGAITSAVYGFGGRLFAGTRDSIGGAGTGLAVSDDNGDNFFTNYTGLDDVQGENKYIREFASFDHFLFLAAVEAGLYMSSDSGYTWQKVYIDENDTTLANGRSVAYSVAADSNLVWVGTDSGAVLLEFDETGAVVSRQNSVFVDGADNGGRSYRMAVQRFTDTLGNVDSTAVWALNHPLDTSVGIYAVYYTLDSGATWGTPQDLSGFPKDIPQYDIGFSNALIFMTGLDKFTQSPDRSFWYAVNGNTVKDSVRLSVNFDGQAFRSFLISNDTIYIGADSGFAVSYPGSAVLRWHLVLSNTDPNHFDNVSTDGFPDISGNFVNAIGIQPLDNGQSRVWASTHPTDTGYNAISTATLDGENWRIPIEDVNCWNFEFNGPEVFTATSQGLFYSPDTGLTWSEIPISGNLVTGDEPIAYTIDPEAMVTAVKLVGDTLWVGTGEGAAKIALDQIGTANWEIYRVHDNTEVVYAFPVPFSHAAERNTTIKFHYNVPEPGNVSIEVYDFAMNLVKTVADEYKTAGVKEDEDTWDGLNEQGHYVAAGIYYFKITLPSGKEEWGKLAIIP